jgi:GDP-L-fucose synthase
MTSQVEVEKLFSAANPEYVFLAAARVGGILANSTYKAEFIYQNIMIAANIIEASYRHNVKKLLNLGSSCIYPKFSPQPMKEEYLLTGELEPTNEPYAIAKISAIKLCRYYNEQYGTNFISVMPTNMYGPGDNYDLMNSHVLPALIRKFHLGKLLMENDLERIKKDFLAMGNSRIQAGDRQLVIQRDSDTQSVMEVLNYFGVDRSADGNVTVTLWGTGSPYREFLYSDDLADAVIFLMDEYNYSDIGEFVNIGAGKEATIKEMAHIVAETVGYKAPSPLTARNLTARRENFLMCQGWKDSVEREDPARTRHRESVSLVSRCLPIMYPQILCRRCECLMDKKVPVSTHE